MLKHLSIRNYILIRELEMDFQRGFTVITGETGAGKSIFLGALGLLLGERADSSGISDPSEKCVIEGEFDISGSVGQDFFDENELDYETTCIIRREILPNGKSRAFINDTPVGLPVLKLLGEKLVDIHSQHSTVLLARNSFHLSLLDAVAGTGKIYQDYVTRWSSYQKLLKTLEDLKSRQNENERDRDYLTFLLNEISELNTFDEENEQLEHEMIILQNAGKIKSVLLSASSDIKFSENNIISQLGQTVSNLNSISELFVEISEIKTRLKSAGIELDDIASELSALEEKIQVNPERMIAVEERLDQIRRLLYKHKVHSSLELLKIKKDFEMKLTQIDQYNEEIDQLEKQSAQLKKELSAMASEISLKRTEIIPGLESEIEKILHTLSMPNAKFGVRNNRTEIFTVRGFDNISFYFSANRGEDIQELSKVASGGEMSRVMLAVKSVIARTQSLPTLIFDEIDSGISGETARKMAAIFEEMGKTIQLLVITHLPQVAAKADIHLLVSKTETAEKSYTHMQQLNDQSRVDEIAKMLGGDNYSQTTFKTAQELLQ